MTTKEIPAMSPVLVMKSPNEYPKEVPIIILGGSPHMVAEPPRRVCVLRGERLKPWAVRKLTPKLNTLLLSARMIPEKGRPLWCRGNWMIKKSLL